MIRRFMSVVRFEVAKAIAAKSTPCKASTTQARTGVTENPTPSVTMIVAATWRRRRASLERRTCPSLGAATGQLLVLGNECLVVEVVGIVVDGRDIGLKFAREMQTCEI